MRLPRCARWIEMAGIGWLFLGTASILWAADNEAEAFRAGKNFIETKVYTVEEDQKVIDYFKGLRVSDVTDGMDKAGLADIGLMDPAIHPLWKDTEHYT